MRRIPSRFLPCFHLLLNRLAHADVEKTSRWCPPGRDTSIKAKENHGRAKAKRTHLFSSSLFPPLLLPPALARFPRRFSAIDCPFFDRRTLPMARGLHNTSAATKIERKRSSAGTSGSRRKTPSPSKKETLEIDRGQRSRLPNKEKEEKTFFSPS